MTAAGGAEAELAPAAARRQELAAFLRSRRERISPEQVGLPETGRRRTPGLRREEVAHLATVGVTWYTWLEQGRDIQVSAQVLQSVARALMLDPTERAHLFVLAGAEDPAPIVECATVTPAARMLLAQLEPMPAAVLNSRYDVLAYNRAYTWIAGDLDALPFEDRNLMWLAFTGSEFQRSLVDIEEARPAMVAKFRTAMADHGAEPAWKTLLNRLRKASPEFEEMWQQHEVAGLGNGLKRFLVPDVGLMRFEYTNLWLGPRPGPRLVAYTPQDEETRGRLEALSARS
ncbi:helix-turn-helix transcriptional regulator [Kitasatospora sp. DSM 101779]|uniref:helix-turn-helix transcriptional regulator n=1 Tax=Kitasatospora sp. DSM 101779 TaxID=2853165 RepID=UPI0021D95933|nr:helix-turn-helix transcriptional regulator [Kitasatospora sp. DSM 101779]MCU7824900.1 helix-turn-helix transcriptional regulator [Kitasatospora sp. DSM 101779]